MPARRRDTIITFNYDTLIERALRNLAVPFHYGFRRFEPMFDSSFPRIGGPRADAPVSLLKCTAQ